MFSAKNKAWHPVGIVTLYGLAAPNFRGLKNKNCIPSNSWASRWVGQKTALVGPQLKHRDQPANFPLAQSRAHHGAPEGLTQPSHPLLVGKEGARPTVGVWAGLWSEASATWPGERPGHPWGKESEGAQAIPSSLGLTSCHGFNSAQLTPMSCAPTVCQASGWA